MPDLPENFFKECERTFFSKLPPQLRQRLIHILRTHEAAILLSSATVSYDLRSNGARQWRLELRSGKPPNRIRHRLYVGPVGGVQLRLAIKAMRMRFWGSRRNRRGLRRALRGIEEKLLTDLAAILRDDRRRIRDAASALAASHNAHFHGRSLRSRRSSCRP